MMAFKALWACFKILKDCAKKKNKGSFRDHPKRKDNPNTKALYIVHESICVRKNI